MACVKVLLDKGADINLPDPDGVSPLNVAIMNANWDLAKQLIVAGADVNQWDIYGEAPLFTAIGLRTKLDGGHASIDPPNETDGMTIIRMLLDRHANTNMQLFFRPAGVSGKTVTRGSTPLIRAATNADMEVVKLLLAHDADVNLQMADRQTPTMAVLSGRANEKQALEMIRLLHEAGEKINVIALVNHREETRGGTALHYAVRKRYKDVIKELASYGIDMNAKDQDGLTALDYTQSRGFMPFMALQTPKYNDVAALLRELGATVEVAKTPPGCRCRYLAGRRAASPCTVLHSHGLGICILASLDDTFCRPVLPQWAVPCCRFIQPARYKHLHESQSPISAVSSFSRAPVAT
jgi:ankyrin repeat protein